MKVTVGIKWKQKVRKALAKNLLKADLQTIGNQKAHIGGINERYVLGVVMLPYQIS